MAELLLLLTAVCVLVCMWLAYSRSRDPLHPLMYLGPMLLYVFVSKPGLLILGGKLQVFLKGGQIDLAQFLFSVGVAALCGGVLYGGRGVRRRVQFVVTPGMRPRLVRLGASLGMLSVAAYWVAIFMSGGFIHVYSHSKGYYSAGSGWVNELVNLSIPSAALLVLAWNGEGRYRRYLGWALFFSSPLLVHGILGARRGPTFTILAAMLVAWYIRSRRRIPVWKVVSRFGLICVLVLFLFAHRQQIRLGADVDFSLSKFWEKLAPSELTTADDTVFTYGFVNGVNDAGKHYWGVRYAATYLVRPIPKQLWPTKYEDLGLGWMVDQDLFGGITDEAWEKSLGWVPERGSAVGFTGDLFLEFGWVGLGGCFLAGWFFGWTWSQAVRRRGLWTLLFLQAAALSIYVPTQSVSAVFHRFLFMSVPLIMVWRMYIGRGAGGGRRQRWYRQQAAGPVIGVYPEMGVEPQQELGHIRG